MGGRYRGGLSRHWRGTVLASTDQEIPYADQEGLEVREEDVLRIDRTAQQRLVRLLAHQRAVDRLQLPDPVNRRTERGCYLRRQNSTAWIRLHVSVRGRALSAIHRDADAPLGHLPAADRDHGAEVAVPGGCADRGGVAEGTIRLRRPRRTVR